MWHFLYNSQVGILGWVGAWLGVPVASPLADLRWALLAVAAVETWRLLPLAAFLFVPGVQAAPPDELDDATLLGGPPWTVLRVVVLPRLRVLLLTLLLLIGTTLTALDSILVLTGGGPGSHSLTPALYSHDLVVDGHDWPQATAAAWLLLGLISVRRAGLHRGGGAAGAERGHRTRRGWPLTAPGGGGYRQAD